MDILTALAEHVKIHVITDAVGSWIEHTAETALQHVADHGALLHLTTGDTTYALTLVPVPTPATDPQQTPAETTA